MRFPIALYAAALLIIPAIYAQQADVKSAPVSDTDIQLLRSDIQADKNDIIAHTMQFTDAESAAFWPIYRDYASEQQKIGDQRIQLVKDYASWADSLDDAKANNMAERYFSIQNQTTSLQQSYWPKFEKALGAKRAMKFFQVDSRLSLILQVQLTANIPILP